MSCHISYHIISSHAVHFGGPGECPRCQSERSPSADRDRDVERNTGARTKAHRMTRASRAFLRLVPVSATHAISCLAVLFSLPLVLPLSLSLSHLYPDSAGGGGVGTAGPMAAAWRAARDFSAVATASHTRSHTPYPMPHTPYPISDTRYPTPHTPYPYPYPRNNKNMHTVYCTCLGLHVRSTNCLGRGARACASQPIARSLRCLLVPHQVQSGRVAPEPRRRFCFSDDVGSSTPEL